MWRLSSGSWRYSLEGFNRLIENKRIVEQKTVIRAITYYSDFPFTEITSVWTDTGPELSKSYVVQTNENVIQRCMLMTTDPGDLVFDPTCGSGTTAIAAERWGRRWITCDVSRVPLALTRQRLLTASYDYYKLRNEQMGPAGGFVYERKQNAKGEQVGGIVPRITLKSIANAEPTEEVVLTDKPERDGKFTRVTGPFCVEAVLPPSDSDDGGGEPVADQDRAHAERMRAALDLTGKLQLPGNRTLELADVRAPARSMHLDAEGRVNGAPGAFLFGAPDAAVSELAVIDAAKEARLKGFEWLVAVGFAIAPEARAAIENWEGSLGLRAVYAQASGDLVLGDLLKNARSNQLFAVCGLPDVALRRAAETGADNEPLYEAELLGLDVFDPDADQVESRAGADVPCWMIDTDYDGQCFRAGQVFFPRTRAWDKIKRAVKADFDESVWDRLAGAASAPFPAGEYNQIAVKVIDDRGNELLVVKSLSDVK